METNALERGETSDKTKDRELLETPSYSTYDGTLKGAKENRTASSESNIASYKED